MPCDTVINPATACAEETPSEATPCSVTDTPTEATPTGTITINGGTESAFQYLGTYTITETCDCPYTGSAVVVTETAYSDLSQENANAQAYVKALAKSQTVSPVCTVNYPLLQTAINNRNFSPFTFTHNTLAELITAFNGIDQTAFYILNSDLSVYNGRRYSAAYFTPTTVDEIYTSLRMLKHKYTGTTLINPLVTSTIKSQLISLGLWVSDSAINQGIWLWVSLASRSNITFTQTLNLTMDEITFPYGGYVRLNTKGPPYTPYFPSWPEWASFNTDRANHAFVKTYDWPESTNFYAPTFEFFRNIYSASFINDLASPFYGPNPKPNSTWVTPGASTLYKYNGTELNDNIYTQC
jgi:hypothetical protein